MPTPDYAHLKTDEELAALEERIGKVYGEAAKEIQKEIDSYFENFKKRDAEQLAKVESGEISENDYKNWRLAQIGRGKRYEALRDKLAERMTKANEVATEYINDTTPSIYSLNRNYAAYTIEQVADDVDFTLWDEQTVKRLLVEQPDLIPYYPPERAVKRGIDLEYGKKMITKQVTSGILMGESLPKIATRLQKDIPDMNRKSAVRAARTAVTGAQNAGRLDSYIQAEKMGVKTEKKWLATLDGRTRHSHAMLDCKKVLNDEMFPNGCMFPGDPNGPPREVYNCRCTMYSIVNGVDTRNAQRRARDPITGKNELVSDMTWSEWMASKRAQYGDEAIDIALKKIRNQASDRKQYQEYKSILGGKIPKKFADFQDLKYNNPDKWKSLKTEKRQTAFVNNVPCVTTPKKYSGYFLKPGAKHAEDFLNVGYAQENPLQLRYDMARQFDMEKAVEFSTNEKGEEKFNIYMQLGVEKKKRFRTCWQKDTPDSTPRILTAFRDDKNGNQ